MKPRKTSPTEGLVGIAMHVLFVFFIPLCCRVAAMVLDSLGRNAPRGGRMYCDTCERRIVRIPPQEHLRQGRLHPQCPRCGSKVEPLPPLMTRKLAIRLLRRKSDLSACSIRLLEDVARRSNGLSRQEARMKSIIETTLDSRLRQISTLAQGSRQMMPRQSHTNSQEHPSRCRGQSAPPSRGSCVESSFGLLGGEMLDGDPNANRDQTQNPSERTESEEKERDKSEHQLDHKK